MHEKAWISDLIYATRTLCEALRDRNDVIADEELKDFLEEVESCLDKFSTEDDDDLFE